MSDSKKLKVKLVKSTIGAPKKFHSCVKALGLRRMHHEVLVQDNSTTRGLIHKINHLLQVEEV